MSRQGAGTSVPAPLAYLGGCVACVCDAAGVPGAARAVLRARPLRVLVGGGLSACCLLPRQISGRRAAYPPARRPRRELRSARRLEARPGPAGLAAASNRSGCLCVAWPGAAAAHGHRSQALRSLQRPTHQWGWVADDWLGAAPRSPLVPSGPSGALHTSGAGCADVWLGACCYKRRQSKVFFVWISAPLLQTSSIRGLFR